MNNNNNIEFMPFGSIMNALQGQLTPDNWEEIADAVLDWCRKQKEVSHFPFNDIPIKTRLCPACGAGMIRQTQKSNPKAPDWKCSDKTCKKQWDKSQQAFVDSNFVTGVWDKDDAN